MESSSTNGSICRAPNEQFSPTERRGNPLTLARKASSVCPLRVRPARSLGVEDGLYEHGVDSTPEQCFYLLLVGGMQLVVGDVACGGVAHVGTHGTGLVGGAYGAADKAGPLGGAEGVGRAAGYAGSLEGHLGAHVLQMVVGL